MIDRALLEVGYSVYHQVANRQIGSRVRREREGCYVAGHKHGVIEGAMQPKSDLDRTRDLNRLIEVVDRQVLHCERIAVPGKHS